METANPLLAVALALTTACAAAHDSWLAVGPGTADEGAAWLALGTGNQFPKQETGIDAAFLVRRGCRADRPVPEPVERAQPAGSAGRVTAQTPAPKLAVNLALKALRNVPTALLLQVPRGATTCWVQLTPFDVEVAPDLVPVYLKEIQATPEIRATWAAMQARGLPWRERYTKHARIELGTPSTLPTQLGLDLRIENAGTAATVGAPLSVQALLDGEPLAGLAIELRSETSPLGIWRRTDGQGRINVTPPLPGRWLLRGVDLRVSPDDVDRWASRFVTLAFDVTAGSVQTLITPTAPTPRTPPSPSN